MRCSRLIRTCSCFLAVRALTFAVPMDEKLTHSCILFATASLVCVSLCKLTAIKRRRDIEPVGPPKTEKFTSPRNVYDAVIIGAGPAGATAAYFMGKQGLRVALIDKKTFPRPKPCGDAWCKPALDILEEMGVLSKMESDGIARPVKRGGFISPFGYKCINTDGTTYGSVTGCKTYAIKRFIADEYLVKAATSWPSVHFFPGTEVTDLTFQNTATSFDTDGSVPAGSPEGMWTAAMKSPTLPINLTGIMVLICDGSTSYLAQKLGVIPKGLQSEATCSHAYVKGSSHTWTEADGVMIFNKSVLPGYSALFRHYNDDMYLGTYILPGGQATSRAIAPFEAEAIAEHPYIRDAFGNDFQWEEKRVVAPIRCGGVPKSYAQQLLLVGDAAGHVDPLTGEGIHTAMVAGKIAAQTVSDMFANFNFGINSCRAYELRCYDAFGYEFVSSSWCAKVIYALPLSLDAVAVVGQRRGQPFLDFFGEVMTGVRPKSDFLQPDLLLDITLELVRQFWIQYVMCYEPLMPANIGVEVVKKQALSKKVD